MNERHCKRNTTEWTDGGRVSLPVDSARCIEAEGIIHYNESLSRCSVRGGQLSHSVYTVQGSVWVNAHTARLCKCVVHGWLGKKAAKNLARHLPFMSSAWQQKTTATKKHAKFKHITLSPTLSLTHRHACTPQSLVSSLMGLCSQTDSTNGS